MNTKPLEKFAQNARRQLHEQVAARLEQVLRTDSPELRAKAQVVAELNKQIARSSRQAVVERVAYTWFNRFIALRYMDANHYTRIGVVSPAAGHTQPEILQEAKAGFIDPDLAPHVDSQRIFDLLSGRIPSPDGQAEAYRELLRGSCNQYHAVMPFLFEKIDDYTELLMPDDLLSANSILQAVRETLTEEVCQDVEVIGWLYQFYISEKKDEVIGAKKAIAPDDIPAATQLFTPNWIVRYLVQNSLGRLWLLNRPNSRLAEQMEFYIREPYAVNRNSKNTNDDPRHTEHGIPITDYLKINSPEDLTICDPAVGSGHMLTYAFDLLYAIYEEEGYNARDIPRLILQKNLTGLEIDERAAALAAFALTMKARAKDRRFFRRGVEPAIITLRPITFTRDELDAEVDALAAAAGLQEERDALRHDLALFAEAGNFGSLLRPRLTAAQLTRLRGQLAAPAAAGQLQLFDEERRQKALQAVTQAIPLARQYDVVIANPPYMGNFNPSLKKFAKTHFPDSKSDLFAMFMERNLDLARPRGLVAMVNMQSWMFLSSYEKLREKLLTRYTIVSMAHIGARGFDTIGGEVVSTTAFVLANEAQPAYKGSYVRLVDGRSEAEKAAALREAIQNPDCGYFYRAAATDFKKIPGSPIAYWVSNQIRDTFSSTRKSIHDLTISDGQTKTGDNDRFLRQFWEVAQEKVGYPHKWWLHPKGGAYRKWYGNVDWVINWSDEARKHYREDRVARILPEYLWNQPGISWTLITSGKNSFRVLEKYQIFNLAAPSLFFHDESYLLVCLGLLNTKYATDVLQVINPTINMNVGEVRSLPVLDSIEPKRNVISQTIEQCILIEKRDWNSYETSWDFTTLPLLQARQPGATLAATYAALRQQWQAATLEMQRLEEENNRLFIEAYGLQDELTPDVPLEEITLTCNPHYRYSGQSAVNSEQYSVISQRWPEVTATWPEGDEGLELRLLADTLREFISYAVGCMFGRYSLDKPGLILANQGETVEDYVRKIAVDHSQFPPDEDNAIPILDGDWFPDDITERFKKFLRVTFGEAHYAENLAFIETALGRDIRSYFLRDFYDHHVKMYKKRPIYWLFSSPKGSFNCLIYMHRYKPDTVSVVLNDYLREFRAKLNARKSLLQEISISAATAQREKTRALKEIDKLDKILKELRDYEDDILYPLATRRVEIDLDDGVKVNYNKFGKALKKVPGLTE